MTIFSVSNVIIWLAAIYGLIVGSFLNVVIWRLPRGESIVFPGSHCGACGHALGVFENIPLLSWLCLRGRCAHCRERISARYPLVEAMVGALFVLAALEFHSLADIATACVVAACLVAATFIDIEHLYIPDGLVLGILCAGIVHVLISPTTALMALGGAATGAGIFGLVYLVSGGRAMGLGDVKLAGAAGLVLGAGASIGAIVLAVVTGAAVGIVLMACGRAGKDGVMPFGPFIAIGTLVMLFAPAIIWSSAAWYLTAIGVDPQILAHWAVPIVGGI